jgi:hypothetical protein
MFWELTSESERDEMQRTNIFIGMTQKEKESKEFKTLPSNIKVVNKS